MTTNFKETDKLRKMLSATKPCNHCGPCGPNNHHEPYEPDEYDSSDDEPHESYTPRGNRCRHLRRAEDDGTPFCTDCGLVFEDEVVYLSEYYNVGYHNPTDHQDAKEHNMDYHHPIDRQDDEEHNMDYRHPIDHQDDEEHNMDYHNPTDHQDDEEHNMDYHHPIDHQDDEEHTPTTTKPEPTTKPSPTPKPTATPASTPTPTSVKDLRRIAKERWIKYSTTMSKKDLCMVLGLEIFKPIKYLFKNKETGEEHGFHSIYRASKEMGINPGLVSYYLGKETTIGEITYAVSGV